MIQSLPRIFTIAASGPFLEVLAEQILDGFPLDASDQKPLLTDWTILLPTRRATRVFIQILASKSGQGALLLPRVKPIGDFDDEAEFHTDSDFEASKYISQNGLLFLLLDLISDWARKNPDIELAQNISASPRQRLGLALSLRTLLHQLDTQEMDLSNLPLAYELELSEHRQAILELLGLIHHALPARLGELHLARFASWRNEMLRREATRLGNDRAPRPIIVAGSTGTIPATRALLRAASEHPMGAIVLPGLDQVLDDESWESLAPEHPQYSMKRMLEEFGTERDQVQRLGASNHPKSFLMAELLRPTSTAQAWHNVLPPNREILEQAVDGISLIETRDRHTEARVIAHILRQSLSFESPKSVALVTPDRDLAARVKNELARWNIAIDDSAGFPLSKIGLAEVCVSLAQTVLQSFSATLVFDLLKRSDVTLGLERAQKNLILHNIEIAILRNVGLQDGIDGLSLALARSRAAKEKGERLHPMAAKLEPQEWEVMDELIQATHEVLAPLDIQDILPQTQWLSMLGDVLNRLTAGSDETLPENAAFREAMEKLTEDSQFLSPCDLQTCLVNLVQVLETTPYRPTGSDSSNLAIYGTLEARLLPIDVVILGGLNEGVWPAEPDTGPWLNRPMRDLLTLAQPEREIGLAAHDFIEGLGHSKVLLTWSRRISGAPVNPSRWILRLRNVLKGAGLAEDLCDDTSWTDLVRMVERVEMKPHIKPRPSPKVEARPTSFSVTEIESLLRDPYGIYAKKILGFEPLQNLTDRSDARLRGILFHAAIAEWIKQQRGSLSDISLTLLLEAGEAALQPLMGDLDVSGFWVPAFARIALWLQETEITLRENAVEVFAELAGKLNFAAGSVPHVLTGRADRIDRLKDGTFRIIDYKTGEVPSVAQVKAGFSPQLLLEAMILKEGGFKTVQAGSVSELIYIKLSSGRASSESQPVEFKDASIDDKATQQFRRLQELLRSYQSPEKTYLPRRAPRTELQELLYDHLSRFAEWILAEE